MIDEPTFLQGGVTTHFGASLRRKIFCAAVVLAAAQVAQAQAAPQSDSSPRNAATRRPNIILILADDLGYGELGCYGQKTIRTPNIDRIAAEGIRYSEFYCGAPVCAPCRCVLMTGKHLGHAYVRDNGEAPQRRKMKSEAKGIFPGQLPIPATEVTIAELLKGQGYATAAIGKWGLGYEGSSGDPNRQGFDLFYGFLCQWHAHNHYPRFLWRNGVKETLPGNNRTLEGETYSQDKFTQTALEFIRDNKERPFFLYLPFAIPHLSIQVPEASLAEYRGKIPEEKHDHHGYLKHPHPRAGYAAMVTHMDRDVGRILELVGELGLDEDTLVLFTSDNGPTYDRLGGSDSKFFESAGPFRGFKGSVYDGGIHVPLVARWPGKIKPGQTSDLISAQWDLLPTFCELAGTAQPSDTDGVSLLPTLLSQGEQRQHEYLYWEFPSYGGQQAIRYGDWKGVRQNMISKNNRKLELYNLAADVSESRDLADTQPGMVAKLESLMKQAHRPAAVKRWNFVDHQAKQPARTNKQPQP